MKSSSNILKSKRLSLELVLSIKIFQIWSFLSEIDGFAILICGYVLIFMSMQIGSGATKFDGILTLIFVLDFGLFFIFLFLRVLKVRRGFLMNYNVIGFPSLMNTSRL